MAFCTYDWFGDATASYYACRKACEPLHIQWNPVAECVEVVNYCAGDRANLLAVATLYSLNGTIVSTQARALDAREDSTNQLFGIDFPEDDVCFLRLELFEGEQLISHNDYFIPKQEDNLQALNALPQVKLDVSFAWDPDSGLFNAKVSNPSDTPALMLHLTARDADGDRILPAAWSDNYIHLMPGEERTLTLSFPDKKTFAYQLRIDGFNTAPLMVREKKHQEVVE